MILKNLYPSTPSLNKIIVLAIATGSFTSFADAAAEKKTYTKPLFATFSSQMSDALLGSSKYEKPIWNLHDALKLPEWLSMSLEQRTRYETLSNTFLTTWISGFKNLNGLNRSLYVC